MSPLNRREPEAQALTEDEARLLIDLCRAGKLYEVERWIASGRSLRVPSEFKRTPLQMAVERGFHSLIELLVRNETNQEAKNRALADAVSRKQLEFVKLLIEYGADVRAIPLADVLLTWEPSLVRFFLENGADVVTGAPFAEAFGSKVRTALGPYVQHKRAHPELADELQQQADRALRYFCLEGNLKWVSLMLWAGANPRARGPNLNEEDDPECYTTALREACYSGNVEVLKKVNPQVEVDDLAELLDCAALLGRTEVLRYLLELGPILNDRPDGGSTVLSRCLWHLRFESSAPFFSKQRRSLFHVYRTMETIRALVERGAIWKPKDPYEMNSLRRTLSECEPLVTVELVKILKGKNACPEETLHKLLHAPRMKEHLIPEENKLVRLGIRLRPKQPPAPPYALLARYDREKLYNEVWSEPMHKVAKKYGISDVALAKVCRRLQVPLPGRGYWAKRTAGKRVRRQPRLPALAMSNTDPKPKN